MATVTSIPSVRARLSTAVQAKAPSLIQITANPLADQDPALAHAVEATARELLSGDFSATLVVRFRVCQDLAEGLRFICKIESPPVRDVDGEPTPWRWWSPLMETAQDFRAALTEALEVRRERLLEGAYSAR